MFNIQKNIASPLVVFFVLIIIACNEKKVPHRLVNYNVGEYIEEKDWENGFLGPFDRYRWDVGGIDSVGLIRVDKKIKLEETYFPGAKDSVNLKFQVSSEYFNSLPNPDSLSNAIFECLLKSRYACKNPATFIPKEIWLYVGESKDSSEADFSIHIDFLASNAFGVPGMMKGSYRFDPKTMKLKEGLNYESHY